MKEQKDINSNSEGDIKAIKHLKESVASGKHWYVSLLEAIKLWKSTEESFKGRHYKYLVDGEAFDWLLLAERLCEEISEAIPEQEKIDLLFFDRPPLELTREEFKKLIGAAKYKAYLNYLYGVLVEEALIVAVMNEVRKDSSIFISSRHEDDLDKAYNRIYGAGQQVLYDEYLKDKKYSKRKTITLNELKEFTYWLFKYRLKRNDKSRVASDTKKALTQMQRDLAIKKRMH
ncbi:hypothetical protein ACFLYM_00750 [Chloroflexota bacterium]